MNTLSNLKVVLMIMMMTTMMAEIVLSIPLLVVSLTTINVTTDLDYCRIDPIPSYHFIVSHISLPFNYNIIYYLMLPTTHHVGGGMVSM